MLSSNQENYNYRLLFITFWGKLVSNYCSPKKTLEGSRTHRNSFTHKRLKQDSRKQEFLQLQGGASVFTA